MSIEDPGDPDSIIRHEDWTMTVAHWIDLSAIPVPARQPLVKTLQATVDRLAEGGTGLDPTGAGDALMRELLRRHMAGLLREGGR